MSNTFKLSLIGVAVLIGALAFGQVVYLPKDQQFFLYKNKVINPGFENGTTKWTVSAGTLTASTLTANTRTGVRGGLWGPSASNDTMVAAANTVGPGNNMVSCYLKTSASDYVFQAYDGTNVLNSVTVTGNNTFTNYRLNVAYSAAGQLRPRVLANSNANTIAVDDCYAGEADNLGQTSQAVIIGSAYFAGTASCTWTRTSATQGSFSTNASCPGPTVEFNPGPGTIQTTDTDLPKFTVNNLPAGLYEVTIVATFRNDTNSARSDLYINDGTTTSGRVHASAATGGNDLSPGTMVGYFNYTTSGNRTFEIQGDSSSGTISLFNDTAYQTRFSIKKFPTTSEFNYNPNIYPWKIDANISGADIDLGSSNQSSYITPNNGSLTLVANTNSAPVGISCSSTNDNTVGNTTCPAGSEEPGIVFNMPSSGDVLACASFTHRALSGSGTINAAFEIVETANGSQTISQEGGPRINSGSSSASTFFPLRVCGILKFFSAGKKTIRLMYEQSITATITANVLSGDAAAAVGQRDINWQVFPITQGFAMPFVIGGVSSVNTVASRFEHAEVSSASVVSVESGDWISGNCSSASSTYTCNILSGVFSTAPVCVATIKGSSTGIINIPSTSSTHFQVRTSDATGTASDRAFSVYCYGDK